MINKLPEKQLFVFDVDGVILDSHQIYVDAVKYVCEELGFPKTEEEYRELATDIYYENRVFPKNLRKSANQMLLDFTNDTKLPVKASLINGVNTGNNQKDDWKKNELVIWNLFRTY